MNRVSGYLLFSQAAYLAAFIILSVVDLITHRSLFLAFRSIRSATGLEHTFVGVSDYLYYPFVFSAPLNAFLLVLFLRRLLRDSKDLSLPSDFFSILNAFYVVGSGWVLFGAFVSHLKR